MTGATNGIGYEVARALALADARVLLLSRKTENGEDAISEIRRSSLEDKNRGGLVDVTFVECDLGDLHSVQKTASKIAKEEDRLDIVSLCSLHIALDL